MLARITSTVLATLPPKAWGLFRAAAITGMPAITATSLRVIVSPSVLLASSTEFREVGAGIGAVL